MEEMSNYMASGWKRNLTYIIGCCWVAQVGSLDRDEWHVAIRKVSGGNGQTEGQRVDRY